MVYPTYTLVEYASCSQLQQWNRGLPEPKNDYQELIKRMINSRVEKWFPDKRNETINNNFLSPSSFS